MHVISIQTEKKNSIDDVLIKSFTHTISLLNTHIVPTAYYHIWNDPRGTGVLPCLVRSQRLNHKGTFFPFTAIVSGSFNI